MKILGFTCYAIYNIVFYTSTEIHNEYRQRHPKAGSGPLVRANDIFFAVHAAILSIFTLSQIYCWGYERTSRQVPSPWAVGVVCGSVLGVAILTLIAERLRLSNGLMFAML